MRKYKFLSVLLFFWLIVTGNVYSGSLLPEGLIIEESFKPGSGVSVGKIQLVQGDVIIIHEADELRGYRAKDELPVFKGDTIITPEKGRLLLNLEDGSILTLGSETRLAITRSIYDPANKNRSSFINMATGKARFCVKKLADFSQSEFKVKTQTAVVGVRGSDFIVKTSENTTEVTTLDKTVLEIVSLSALEKKTLLKDFERTTVKRGFIPSDVISVTPEETEEMIKEMPITTPERFESVKLPHDREMERREQKKGTIDEPNAVSASEKSVLIPGTPENKMPGEKFGENPFTETEPAKEGKFPLIEGQIYLQQPLPQVESVAILPETPPLTEPLPQTENILLSHEILPLNVMPITEKEIPMPDMNIPIYPDEFNKIQFSEYEFIKPEDVGYLTESEKFQIDFDIIDKEKVLPDEDSDKYKPKHNKEEHQRSVCSEQP